MKYNKSKKNILINSTSTTLNKNSKYMMKNVLFRIKGYILWDSHITFKQDVMMQIKYPAYI